MCEQLQLIVGAWVLATPAERKAKVSIDSGDFAEEDYDKRSIYSLLYSLYRTIGIVPSEVGEPYEFTFNTWGYTWPHAWGDPPTAASDPERFGKNGYTGLFHSWAAKNYLNLRTGRVHIVEMGCGTGAGAYHLMKNTIPQCTYEAVDMQAAAIQTCKRKFVPQLHGRLKATRGDCTHLPIADGVADFIVVCETHVTEMAGRLTDEDQRFFRTAHRLLKPGGMFVWANAIPDDTWQPCFDFLESPSRAGGCIQPGSRASEQRCAARRHGHGRRLQALWTGSLGAAHVDHLPHIPARRRNLRDHVETQTLVRARRLVVRRYVHEEVFGPVGDLVIVAIVHDHGHGRAARDLAVCPARYPRR